MTRQRMTYVLHGEHISLDGRFLVVIVAPNPCTRHVCIINILLVSSNRAEYLSSRY